MKAVFIILVLTFSAIKPRVDNQGDRDEPQTTDQKIMGVFYAVKHGERMGEVGDWEIRRRYGRKLFLNSDHTFVEQNSSFAAFDYADRAGTWEVLGIR